MMVWILVGAGMTGDGVDSRLPGDDGVFSPDSSAGACECVLQDHGGGPAERQ